MDRIGAMEPDPYDVGQRHRRRTHTIGPSVSRCNELKMQPVPLNSILAAPWTMAAGRLPPPNCRCQAGKKPWSTRTDPSNYSQDTTRKRTG